MIKIKIFIFNIIQNTKDRINFNKIFGHLKDKKKIIYTLIPVHGNLGDQAIAYASSKFLSDKFSEYQIIEMNYIDTYKYTKFLNKIMNKDDIIFMHGGGNMGNHYIWEEEARRHIISSCSGYKIVSFPQTIFFSNDKKGKDELKKSQDIYNNNKDLIIIGREEKSYDTMKDIFKQCNIIKCPDIVFYLLNKLEDKNYNRYKIMTCLREDHEKYISLNKEKQFIDKLKNEYNNVFVHDTIIKGAKVYKEDRENRLLELWEKFFESKVVITDRLHGMIFCAITKTPCIVIRSLDHKVVESYKWVKHLNYIKMVDNLDFEHVQPIIEELINLKELDEIDLDKVYFNNLRKNII